MGTSAKDVLSSMMKEMESFVSSKTVVGDPVNINDTIILPLVDISFGVGAGANEKEKGSGGGGGLGAKITPSAVLVIKDGNTKLVNIKKQDTLTKLIDLVPDVIDKFQGRKKQEKQDPQVEAEIEDLKK